MRELFEQFEKFYNLVKGRKDVKSRVAVIANPDNPKRMSIVTRGEAEYIGLSYFLVENKTWGKIFSPLVDYGKEIMDLSPSIEGKGLEHVIRFMGALSETKLLSKLGVNVKGEEKE